jgi:hypothetical protein
MTEQPEKKPVPWWLTIDVAIILIGMVIIGVGVLIAP